MSAWRLQRLTAILLLPLQIWLIVSLTKLPDFHYQTLIHWLKQDSSIWLSIALLLTFSVHSYLGVEEIITDYVHSSFHKHLAQITLKAFMVFCLLAGLFALLNIAGGLQ